MAARRRTNAVDDLIELASHLPWKVSVGLAVISFLVLTAVASDFQGTASPRNVADLGTTVVHTMYGTIAGLLRWIISPAFLVGAAASWRKQRHRIRLLDEAAGDVRELERLSWRDFERLIGEAYRRQGYAVEEIGGDGPDGGVDLVLRREGRETLVQCKQWRQQQVGVTVVRELRGVMAQRGAAEGIVVGLGGFTREAEAFAGQGAIQLLGRGEIEALVKGLPRPMPDWSPGETSGSKSCPKCGSAMVRRVARRGRHAGQAFFGCSRFPRCRGTASAA